MIIYDKNGGSSEEGVTGIADLVLGDAYCEKPTLPDKSFKAYSQCCKIPDGLSITMTCTDGIEELRVLSSTEGRVAFDTLTEVTVTCADGVLSSDLVTGNVLGIQCKV